MPVTNCRYSQPDDLTNYSLIYSQISPTCENYVEHSDVVAPH